MVAMVYIALLNNSYYSLICIYVGQEKTCVKCAFNSLYWQVDGRQYEVWPKISMKISASIKYSEIKIWYLLYIYYFLL